MSLDVTPVPSRPATRERGWVGVVLGAVLLVGSLAATAYGIADAVHDYGALEADAVARGEVREGAVEPVAFRVPEGERQRYTVYLEFGGVESDSVLQERAVGDTDCVVVLPDGVETTFTGARQGFSMQLGDRASVGHFSSQPGPVAVRCAYGTQVRERGRPAVVPFLVAQGSPSELMGSVLWVLGGVAAGLLGGVLLWLGLRGRRRTA